MKTRITTSYLGLSVPLVAGLTLAAGTVGVDPCKQIALEAQISCRTEATSDLWLARANCTNISDPAERIDCIAEAWEDYVDARAECREIRIERMALCDDLGGGVYEPDIDPAEFSTVIDNPYLPLIPGTTWIYEKDDDGEIEHIEVTVTDDTIEIMGVDCVVVRDTVTVDGVLEEDTYDWFAQDSDGNVWYFGELSFEYEDGELSGLDGSWEAGEDGAHAGIVMQAAPMVGQVYRQEYLLREAEDVGAVLSLNETVSPAYGTFMNCLQTEDYSPLEPGALEHKYYAPGIGLVLEVKPDSGEMLELIDVIYE